MSNSNNLGRPLIMINSQNKNERFKKQPKQSHPPLPNSSSASHSQDYNGQADIVRNRKHNQSSLQIAANAIIENNNNNRPSQHVGASGQGLPPRITDIKKGPSHSQTHDYNGYANGGLMGQNNHQVFHTDGDSLTASLEDSTGPHGMRAEIVDHKNTKDYIVDMKKGNNNILVAVRCRPLSKQEKSKQSQKSVKILDEKIIILQDVSAAKPEEAFRLARPKEKTYAFDYAFDEDCGQSYIFERTTKFLIDGIMQGYNASVFAYGSTGAGKTYTMLGTEENPGIMMLSIDELFQCIENYTAERDYKIKISYVEVYNENIKDLLTDRSQEYLELREDGEKGICVAGVTEIMTTNVDEIMRYIRQGNRQRTKERTDANEASSRSHAVLQITVEHKDKAHGINAEISVAKLSLIDLAGSERASNTNNRGMRLVEGANINKSLLALGNCINALCESAKMGPIARQNQHIPYRDSKLTRLLKDSLGGNCRTVMITNISPAFTAYEDTLNTLKYADRAKQIKTIVKRNVLNVEFHISNYTKIINQLREEIISLRSQLQSSGPLASLPKAPNSSGNSKENSQSKQNQIAQNKMKTMKIEMNLQFEKEVLIKKDIYELDMRNEDHAFKLFSKQLQLTKSKNGKNSQSIPQLEQEIKQMKAEIDSNHAQKAMLQQRLNDLENLRTKMLEDYQQEMIQYEIEAIDVLYNQHLLNLKQIDFKRKENRAEFHIKQRDNYIQHLKEQLSLRDRIIKEKLGISLTNFMPNGQQPQVMNQSYYNEIGKEILSMNEIDKMSRELILPSLNMTKSSSFIPNQFTGSPLDNPLAMNKNKLDISDSPYSHGFNTNINASPNQQRAISNTISMTNKNKIAGVRHHQSLVKDDSSAYSGYSNHLKMNNGNASNSNAYYNSGEPKQNVRQGNSSVTKPAYSQNHSNLLNDRKPQIQRPSNQFSHQSSATGNNLISNQSQQQIDSHSEQDQSSINISFQSHRNNSNTKIGIGMSNVYHSNQGLQNQLLQQQLNHNSSHLPPPGTSGAESTSSGQGNYPKSFASEMTKNKQKFMLLQKQQQSNSAQSQSQSMQGNQSPIENFGARGSRVIPKNPLSINKKLSLLKKNAGMGHHRNEGSASGDEAPTTSLPLNYQSSRNQSQNPVSRIGVGSSSLIQNSGSQIANFSIKRTNLDMSSHHLNSSNNIVSSSVNNSIINIADNV